VRVKVLCSNCKEHILFTETDKLSLPLKGTMFEHRPDREWGYFHESAIDLDLVCPMCGWTFHQDNTILTDNGILPINREVASESVPKSPQDSTESVGTETLTESTSPQFEHKTFSESFSVPVEIANEIFPKKKGWPKGKPRPKGEKRKKRATKKGK
jgi:hypothetical protein